MTVQAQDRFEARVRFRPPYGATIKPVAGMGKCGKCKTVRRFEGLRVRWVVGRDTFGQDRFHSEDEFPDVECCGKRVWVRSIQARINEAVPCDGRCMNAKGHNCECSCGGSNHGKAFA